MAITADLQVIGSVSGGCVENDVIESAALVLNTGEPALLGYKVSDDVAWSVGLTCGGRISVYVEKHPILTGSNNREVWRQIEQVLKSNQSAVWITALSQPAVGHALLKSDGGAFGAIDDMPSKIIEEAGALFQQGGSCVSMVDEQRYFLHFLPSQDKILIIGAAHISIPLVNFAKALNFEVTVIEPRKVFSNPDRFSTPPDKLIAEWPHEVLPNMELNQNVFAVLLTHDPKIDDPALHVLLDSKVKYIGALGSKKTQVARQNRLTKAGFSTDSLRKIHGPVGLDIGAKSAEEIALSIIAEIVGVKRKGVVRDNLA